VLRTAFALLADLLRLLRLMFQSRAQLAAENLFLRQQLACYVERQVRPRRTDNASRIALVLLSHFVDSRELLTMVRPDTLVRVASQSLSSLLAIEITSTWATLPPYRGAATHRGDGHSQPHMG